MCFCRIRYTHNTTLFPYTTLFRSKNRYNFQHFFANNIKDNVKKFKESPYVNKEVNDMAIRVLESSSLGTRMNPDYLDRKSTRLNSSHVRTSYAVFCLKKTI